MQDSYIGMSEIEPTPPATIGKRRYDAFGNAIIRISLRRELTFT